MLTLIAKYWLEFLLGLIATGLTFLCKKFWNLYQSEKKHQKSKEDNDFYEKIKSLIEESIKQSQEGDSKLQGQIDLVKNGILSIQKREFIQECKELLQPERDITIEEFEHLQDEHNVYKSLGGNHDGDTLFNMVKEKVTNSLANK